MMLRRHCCKKCAYLQIWQIANCLLFLLFAYTVCLHSFFEKVAGMLREREREKFINHKQINNVTIKIINSCGRLPARKIPSSWPPMQIQIILFYM